MEPRWRKIGLALHASDVAGRVDFCVSHTQAPNVVVLEDRVRVYFCCRPKPDHNGQFVSLGAFVEFSSFDPPVIETYAESPIMELGELGCFDEFGTYPISVIKDRDLYFAYYGGWTRCESVPFDVAIGVATSTDGRVFNRIGNGPVLAASADEPFVITSPKIRKYDSQWVLAYTAGERWFKDRGKPEIIYKLRIAFSDDGLNWRRLNHRIIPDVLGEDEAQACPDIIFRNNRYHMFFCFRAATDFRRNPDRSYRIGYAVSEDLIHWKRNDDLYRIDVSTSGWDSEMVAYPTVFEFNERLYMLYLGNEVGVAGFGVAVLEGDLI